MAGAILSTCSKTNASPPAIFERLGPKETGARDSLYVRARARRLGGDFAVLSLFSLFCFDALQTCLQIQKPSRFLFPPCMLSLLSDLLSSHVGAPKLLCYSGLVNFTTTK